MSQSVPPPAIPGQPHDSQRYPAVGPQLNAQQNSMNPVVIGKLLQYVLTFRITKAHNLVSQNAQPIWLALAVLLVSTLLILIPNTYTATFDSPYLGNEYESLSIVDQVEGIILLISSVPFTLAVLFLVNLLVTWWQLRENLLVSKLRVITFSTGFSYLFALAIMFYGFLILNILRLTFPLQIALNLDAYDFAEPPTLFATSVFMVGSSAVTLATIMAGFLYMGLVLPEAKNKVTFLPLFGTIWAIIVLVTVYVVFVVFTFIAHVLIGSTDFFIIS